MRILAIDPGDTDSGWVIIDADDQRPLEHGKTPNHQLLKLLANRAYDLAVIEMVASYGMPVGAEVFETCVWIGRYQQSLTELGIGVTLTYRRHVKLHLCDSSRANDANVAQALIDRYAHGQRNRGKGTKLNPGWFYGFHADIWQAYALAVTHADALQ